MSPRRTRRGTEEGAAMRAERRKTESQGRGTTLSDSSPCGSVFSVVQSPAGATEVIQSPWHQTGAECGGVENTGSGVILPSLAPRGRGGEGVFPSLDGVFPSRAFPKMSLAGPQPSRELSRTSRKLPQPSRELSRTSRELPAMCLESPRATRERVAMCFLAPNTSRVGVGPLLAGSRWGRAEGKPRRRPDNERRRGRLGCGRRSQVRFSTQRAQETRRKNGEGPCLHGREEAVPSFVGADSGEWERSAHYCSCRGCLSSRTCSERHEEQRRRSGPCSRGWSCAQDRSWRGSSSPWPAQGRGCGGGNSFRNTGTAFARTAATCSIQSTTGGRAPSAAPRSISRRSRLSGGGSTECDRNCSAPAIPTSPLCSLCALCFNLREDAVG
jgi:hypothetical protein